MKLQELKPKDKENYILLIGGVLTLIGLFAKVILIIGFITIFYALYLTYKKHELKDDTGNKTETNDKPK